MYLIDLRTGEMRLLLTLPGEIFSSPVVCHVISSPVLLRDHVTSDGCETSPEVCGGRVTSPVLPVVIVGCRDNFVYCFHLGSDVDS